jgi:hypothetical protein
MQILSDGGLEFHSVQVQTARDTNLKNASGALHLSHTAGAEHQQQG